VFSDIDVFIERIFTLENISIVTRHLNITDAIKNYAMQKSEKLKKFFDWILHVQVTLDIGGDNSHLAEIVVNISRGPTIVAEASNADMYRSIDLAIDKAVSQLKKHKGKIESRVIRQKKHSKIETEKPESTQ